MTTVHPGAATSTLRGNALGISYVLSGTEGTIARLRELLPPEGAPAPPRFSLEVVGADAVVAASSVAVRWLDATAADTVVRVGTGDETEALLAALNESLLRWCGDLTLHAGAVLGGDGVVAFPGVSGLGKSTLVAACARAGFPLVTDEGLWLGEDGRVRPYPRPLALDAASADLLDLPAPPAGRELLLPPTALGPAAPPGPHPVRALLLLERRPGPVQVGETSAGELVHALLGRSFNHFRDPARAVRSVAAAARGAECLRVAYGDARELAAALWRRYGTPR